jgi:hypothetical protein
MVQVEGRTPERVLVLERILERVLERILERVLVVAKEQ